MPRRKPAMFGSARRSKDQRKATRRKSDASGFIRPDGGFAVRPCTVVDLSDSGVKIALDQAQSVPNVFTFLTSRNGAGRRARVKWRNGSQLGAEFF